MTGHATSRWELDCVRFDDHGDPKHPLEYHVGWNPNVTHAAVERAPGRNKWVLKVWGVNYLPWASESPNVVMKSSQSIMMIMIHDFNLRHMIFKQCGTLDIRTYSKGHIHNHPLLPTTYSTLHKTSAFNDESSLLHNPTPTPSLAMVNTS